MKKCVCELCNCGRHRCPHKPTSIYTKVNAPRDLTEYTERFPVHTGLYNPRATMRPKSELENDKKKMDTSTTFKTDYIAHEVTRRQGRQPAEYCPNPEKIDLGTTYNHNFNPYENFKPSAAIRPKDMLRSADKPKMVAIQSYREDFKQWDVQRLPLTKPKYSYQPPTCKFGGLTTFQNDFVPRVAAQRQSFKPPNVVQSSGIPMQTLTSHRQAFVPHVAERRWQRPPDTYKPSAQSLESLTTNRQDFQGLAGGVSQTCKPRIDEYSAMMVSGLPIQEITEHKEQFKTWPVSLPQFHKKEVYVGPTGQMDKSTTMADAFVKHQMQPLVLAKAQPPAKRSTAPLEEHFTAHEMKPTKNLKPPYQPPSSNAPMQDSTMYRSEFTPKRITVCPASFELPPGYVFENVDDRGHKFFCKIAEKDNSFQLPPMQCAVEVA